MKKITLLGKIFMAAVIGAPFMAGSARCSEAPVVQVLPEGAPFSYVYVFGKEAKDRLPPVDQFGPEQILKLLTQYPDFFDPCSASRMSRVIRTESNFEFHRSESKGFSVGWPSKGEPVFRWSMIHANKSAYQADLHFYCVSVFRSGDGFVRCLVPLGAGRECVSLMNLRMKFNSEGMSRNMSRHLSSLAGVKLPPVVICKHPGGKEETFSLFDAVSLSLRCRMVPRSLVSRLDFANEVCPAMPFDTIEIASWNAAKKSDWGVDDVVRIDTGAPEVLDSLALSLSANFHNRWSFLWADAWHGAIEKLSKVERDALPADVKEKGEGAIRRHCDAMFGTLSKEAAGKIMPPVLIAAISGKASEEAGVLSGLKWVGSNINPAAAGKREFPYKQDRVAILREAVALLREAPEGVRLAVLRNLKLKEEKGGLVAVEPDRPIILSMNGAFDLQIPTSTGFARNPDPWSCPDEEARVSGTVMEWAWAWPDLQCQVVEEVEAPGGRKRVTWMRLILPVAPVVAPIRRTAISR